MADPESISVVDVQRLWMDADLVEDVEPADGEDEAQTCFLPSLKLTSSAQRSFLWAYSCWVMCVCPALACWGTASIAYRGEMTVFYLACTLLGCFAGVLSLVTVRKYWSGRLCLAILVCWNVVATMYIFRKLLRGKLSFHDKEENAKTSDHPHPWLACAFVVYFLVEIPFFWVFTFYVVVVNDFRVSFVIPWIVFSLLMSIGPGLLMQASLSARNASVSVHPLKMAILSFMEYGGLCMSALHLSLVCRRWNTDLVVGVIVMETASLAVFVFVVQSLRRCLLCRLKLMACLGLLCMFMAKALFHSLSFIFGFQSSSLWVENVCGLCLWGGSLCRYP